MSFEMIDRTECPACGREIHGGTHIYKTLSVNLMDDTLQVIRYDLCECGMVFLIQVPPQKEFYEHYENVMKNTQGSYLGDVARSARIYKDLYNDIAIGKIKKVLSFGCGRGYLESYMVEHGVEVIGVDFRKPSWNTFKVMNPEHFLWANIVPYFDFALSIHSLEHVIHPISVLERIRKAVVSGGHVMIEVPALGHSSTYTISHPNLFTVYTLERVMELAGLEVIGIRQMNIEGPVHHNLVLNALGRVNDA